MITALTARYELSNCKKEDNSKIIDFLDSEIRKAIKSGRSSIRTMQELPNSVIDTLKNNGYVVDVYYCNDPRDYGNIYTISF